jgi:hypothetical protein
LREKKPGRREKIIFQIPYTSQQDNKCVSAYRVRTRSSNVVFSG